MSSTSPPDGVPASGDVAASDDPGRAVTDAPARPPARWAVWIRGRLRTTVVLGDGTGEHVADLSLHGWPRKRRRMKAATDDADWVVTLRPGALTVDRDGERRMTVDGDEVDLAGRRLVWPAHDGGVHRGRLRDPDDDRVVLAATPDEGGDDAPVAIFDVDPTLPDPLAAALAACAVQLITRPRGSATDGIDPGAGFDIATPF